jgi:hypothetical protein
MAKKTAAPKKSTAIIPEVVGEELQLTTNEGGLIESFVHGLTGFFTRASALETKAKSLLEEARRWKEPTDGDSDKALVERVRAITATKREIEEHWQITATVSRFHRRLTAARDRGVSVLEEATQLGTRLHNSYAEAERRRAREEEDRQRREAEQRAKLDRERELAQLEAAALEAEEQSADLSDREARFVDYYTGPYSQPATAARQAGYKNPDQAAAKLLSQDKILHAIEAKRDAQRLREQAAAKRTAPVEVESVQVKADVAKGDTSRWSGEVLDADLFLASVLDPLTRTRLGIPADVVKIDEVKLNDYARSLHEQLDRWPGVRAKKTTSIR